LVSYGEVARARVPIEHGAGASDGQGRNGVETARNQDGFMPLCRVRNERTARILLEWRRSESPRQESVGVSAVASNPIQRSMCGIGVQGVVVPWKG
jgi:hypothetical protein